MWRPFLAAWREELRAYARAVGLGWREDPTNVELGFARNAIRHRLIPDAEKWVAPGARRALVRFSERAAFDEEGWDSLMPGLLASSGLERTDAGVTVERAALAALHPAVRARVLRAVAAGLGFRLGAERTSRAVAFVTEAGSGRRIDLGGGLVLRRDLDRLSIHRAEGVPDPDRTVVIAGPEAGRDHATLGGRRVRVGWGAVDVCPSAAIERFACAQLRFPLSVRAWADGDRIRVDAGSRKLKQLFLEARVPVEERRAVPVLTDREGEVLWVPGVARSRTARVRPGMPEGSLLPVWFA